jgi:hypothetical protein
MTAQPCLLPLPFSPLDVNNSVGNARSRGPDSVLLHYTCIAPCLLVLRQFHNLLVHEVGNGEA